MTLEHVPSGRNEPGCQEVCFICPIKHEEKNSLLNCEERMKPCISLAGGSNLHWSWGCALYPEACWPIALQKLGQWWRFHWGAGQRRGRSHCIWEGGFCRYLTGSVGKKDKELVLTQTSFSWYISLYLNQHLCIYIRLQSCTNPYFVC